MGKNSEMTDRETIFIWLQKGIFTIKNTKIYKGNKCLKERINLRNRMTNGDPRVDLHYENKRRSINVSHIIWMIESNCIIPNNFEIHHIDENPLNNNYDNLICVHSNDHLKLHNLESNTDIVPF